MKLFSHSRIPRGLRYADRDVRRKPVCTLLGGYSYYAVYGWIWNRQMCLNYIHGMNQAKLLTRVVWTSQLKQTIHVVC